MITQYYIVYADHMDDLEEIVNKKLKEGWEPQGGIAVAVTKAPVTPESKDNRWYTYLQAVVKRD